MDSDRFVVISGCSGGGKSTLLSELGRRGYGTVEEPGRRITAPGAATLVVAFRRYKGSGGSGWFSLAASA